MINFRSWSKDHTKGLLVGLGVIAIAILIVSFLFSLNNGFTFSQNLQRIGRHTDFTSKVMSLAAISILPLFHFYALKKEKWAFGQGLIIAVVLDLLIMLCIKFLL